jgi:hypothetical protein
MLATSIAYPCTATHLQWHQQQHRRRTAAVTWAGPPEQHSCNESKQKLAVFVSGGGSNFKAIHTAILKGHINADVVVSQSCRFIIVIITSTTVIIFSSAVAVLSITTVPRTGLNT